MVRTNTIIAGGFALVKDNPGSVAIWAAIHGVMAVAALLVLMPQLAGSGLFEPGADPDQIRQIFLRSMGAFVGTSLLFSLVQFAVQAVLLSAALRAALLPGEGGPGSLALGMDEVRMAGVMLIVSIGAGFGAAVTMLMITLVSLLIGFIAGEAAWIGVLVGMVLFFAAIGAFVYLLVRLSLVYPLVLLRKEIGFDESWALTRGNFWNLFAAYVVIVLIGVALSLLASFPLMGHQFAEMLRMLSNPEAMQNIEQIQAAQLRAQLEMPLAVRIPTILLAAAANAIATAIGAGGLAAAARALLAGQGGEIGPDSALD